MPLKGRGYAVVRAGGGGVVMLGRDAPAALTAARAPGVLVDWARARAAQFWPES